MGMRALVAALAALTALPFVSGCGPATLIRTHVAPAHIETLDAASPYLKAHLRSGGVYVLSSWRADADRIVGEGSLLDANRTVLATGAFTIPSDSVALFETNVVRPSGANTALTVMFGVTAALAGYCALNPKACFGSCPTFYAPTADGRLTLQAEGFSTSIAPALEATDLDMLYHAHVTGREFVIRVTNEALETHVIRHMELLAARRPAQGRVFVTAGGEFRTAYDLQAPATCRAPEGDCRAALAAFDGSERWSETDATDLAARETIELTFDSPPHGDIGLVITSRQTLLTTFLIYQALAYMGTDAGRWLAALETGGPEAVAGAAAMGRLLGDIEVEVRNDAGAWIRVGSAGETGPLASDTRVVALPSVPLAGAPLHVRLRMARGLWRIEQAVLASLGPGVQPQRLTPAVVRRAGVADETALATLRDRAATLVTLPGDAYDVVFELPDAAAEYELFLESRGYYLEWMREEWIAEENPLMALRMVADPAGMLRVLAPLYKRGEAGMEEIFWNSRYVRQ
jgi:hypothetical protein